METASAVTPPPVAREVSPRTPIPRDYSNGTTRIWHRSPWKWCFSLGVGVTILVILTLASIVGTTIDPLERAQSLIFYTWWYKLLLVALAINISCATVKTIVQKLIPTYSLRVHPRKGFFSGEQLAIRVPFQGALEDVVAAFRKQGFKVHAEGSAGAARTGWYGRFGAPVSHAGMVIVLLAGFASNWLAKEAIVQVPEGRTTTTMQMRNENRDIVPLGFALTVNDFDTGFHPRTRIPSHYISDITARDGQQRILYAGPVEVNHSPRINGWRLHQTSYQELENLARYEVTIAGAGLREPVTTKISPGQTRVVSNSTPLELSVDSAMNWTLVRNGERIGSGNLMPGANGGMDLTLVANRFEPDFVLGEDRTITSRTDELNNPALHVTLFSDGAPIASQWLFGREDMRGFSHAPRGNVSMELLDVHRAEGEEGFVVAVSDTNTQVVLARVLLKLGEEQTIKTANQDAHAQCTDCGVDHGAVAAAENSGDWDVTLGQRVTAYATVLTLTRNPTIPTIYFGCILMMVGLIISFAIPRRDVWFLHDKESGLLHVAARYRHPADQFDRGTRAALARVPGVQLPPTPDKEQ